MESEAVKEWCGAVDELVAAMGGPRDVFTAAKEKVERLRIAAGLPTSEEVMRTWRENRHNFDMEKGT